MPRLVAPAVAPRSLALQGQPVLPAAGFVLPPWRASDGLAVVAAYTEVGELSYWVLAPASCHVATKAGYRFEGIKRGEALHADGWHDMHLHALLSDDPRAK